MSEKQEEYKVDVTPAVEETVRVSELRKLQSALDKRMSRYVKYAGVLRDTLILFGVTGVPTYKQWVERWKQNQEEVENADVSGVTETTEETSEQT